MARPLYKYAVCRISSALPRAIEHTFDTFTTHVEANVVLMQERDKARAADTDPYLIVVLPFDRKGGAYFPLECRGTPHD